MRTVSRMGTSIAAVAFAFVWSPIGMAAGKEPDCLDKNARPVAALVASAETAIDAAAERGALWTVAVDALNRAREAVIASACDQAVLEAEAARAFAELGIAQLDYPPYRIR